MPHIVEPDPEPLWKSQLREQVMQNLEIMVQEANAAYKRKLAENSSAVGNARYRLEFDHSYNLQNLKTMAEEELRAMIREEEEQRKQSLQWEHPEEVDQTLVEEQIAILHQIRQQSMSRSIVEGYNGAYFQQGSSSKPISHSRTGSIVYDHPDSQAVHIIAVNSKADEEARLRAEKHERQQEEFRQRASTIMQRKRQERKINNQIDWVESMSSSSSATSISEYDISMQDERPVKIEDPMSQEDIGNLVVFHDQQWIFITSLPHLQWTDFPWPILSFSSPKSKIELTTEAIVEYVFAPLSVRDRTVVKDRLKDLIRRWHPDRFETKYLALVADLHEREEVREGAGIVARILNDLLGKWNDL